MANSIMTNASAMTALKTLNMTNRNLEKTQSHISTGYKVAEASDNAAYWSISTTMRSDNKALSTVNDALGLGGSTVDVAYTALNSAKTVLDEIKTKLVAAKQPGVDKSKVQSEIGQLQKQLQGIASAASFSGSNWLSVNSDQSGYNATQQVVSSFSRGADGVLSVGTINIDTTKIALFDSSTSGVGLLEKAAGNTSAGTVGNGTASGIAAANATAGKVTSQNVIDFTGVDALDNVTFDVKIDGAASPVSVNVAMGANLDALVTNLNGTGAGQLGSGAVASNVGGKLVITSALTGANSSASISNVAYTDGGRTSAKLALNFANTGNTTSNGVAGPPATAGSVTSQNVLSFTGTRATDHVKFTMTADGGSAVNVDVALGADIDALVANLNGTGTGKLGSGAVASNDGGRLKITSATTGGSSAIVLGAVTYDDGGLTTARGASLNLTGTGNASVNGANAVTAKAAALTGAAAFTSALTLDADDNITFNVAVDGAAAKQVKVSKATVDAALSSSDGKINTAGNMATVLNQALTDANVSGVTVSVGSGVDGGKLVFTSGITGSNSSVAVTGVAASNGGSSVSVMDINITNATDADLDAYIAGVDKMAESVTTAASDLGAVKSRITMQTDFVKNLMDAIDRGVGTLVDADMNEESTKLQALQVQQQLGIQALSMANSSSQSILSLFRG